MVVIVSIQCGIYHVSVAVIVLYQSVFSVLMECSNRKWYLPCQPSSLLAIATFDLHDNSHLKDYAVTTFA